MWDVCIPYMMVYIHVKHTPSLLSLGSFVRRGWASWLKEQGVDIPQVIVVHVIIMWYTFIYFGGERSWVCVALTCRLGTMTASRTLCAWVDHEVGVVEPHQVAPVCYVYGLLEDDSMWACVLRVIARLDGYYCLCLYLGVKGIMDLNDLHCQD